MCESVRVERAERSVRRPRNAYELAPKHPGRVAELGLRRVQHGALVVADALEVPPAAAIAREDEVAVGAPLGLPDRLARRRAPATCSMSESSPFGARSATWSSQPSHGIHGQVPGEEAEPRAVGRDARVRVEVAAARDRRVARRIRPWQRDELVDDVGGAIALGVPLADADPETARPPSRARRRSDGADRRRRA